MSKSFIALRTKIIKELASSGAKSHKSRPSFVKVSKQEAMEVVPL